MIRDNVLSLENWRAEEMENLSELPGRKCCVTSVRSSDINTLFPL
jgi:hypothetical protein